MLPTENGAPQTQSIDIDAVQEATTLSINLTDLNWHRLLWLATSMFNQHTKFEVSTITCSEDMKVNSKCENSRFEPPFGDLG